ncbi:hypothetical protein AND4_05864 [Vibrio sp. AND4]|nr:hypothetical protein AND4_05864 [Vibrio sp. AND4]
MTGDELERYADGLASEGVAFKGVKLDYVPEFSFCATFKS